MKIAKKVLKTIGVLLGFIVVIGTLIHLIYQIYFVCKEHFTILNLMLRLIGYHIHAIEFFDEIAFPKEGANNSQTAGWDNTFICKLNNNVLIGVLCDSVAVIHGKRLQSIDFVMSILPQTAFTWWVNNNIGKKYCKSMKL